MTLAAKARGFKEETVNTSSWNRIILILPLLLLLSGCAIARKENRRTLNALDKTVKIESTAGKIAAAPVFVPVGFVAGAGDAVVVHPAVSVPEAGRETYQILWEDPQGSDFHQAMLFFPKVGATPVVFITDWAIRVLFPIEDKDVF